MPSRIESFQFTSGGVQLGGQFYRSDRPGRRPTCIFIHGIPGSEKNLDIAGALVRRGLARRGLEPTVEVGATEAVTPLPASERI